MRQNFDTLTALISRKSKIKSDLFIFLHILSRPRYARTNNTPCTYKAQAQRIYILSSYSKSSGLTIARPKLSQLSSHSNQIADFEEYLAFPPPIQHRLPEQVSVNFRKVD